MKVHREFASKLFALYRNIRKAMERHEDLSQTLRRPAELIMGSFDGIKHDTDGFDKQGMRLLLATLNRIFDSLQTTYEGFQTSTVKAIYIFDLSAQEHVGAKFAVQIRSRAQKFFSKAHWFEFITRFP
ncbi:hypothetical protein V6Z11_D01G164000 [Gossypium hirsutum]